MSIKEIWKPVKGYEGLYEVSNIGRVRSLDRIMEQLNRNQYSSQRFMRKFKGILLKNTNRNGYNSVSLQKYGNVKQVKISRLVLSTFLSEPINKSIQVNHKNGVKNDDYIKNLEWVTPIENTRHAWKNGLCTYKKSPQHIQSLRNRWLRDRSVPIEIVKQIKNLRNKTGLGKRKLSYIFGINEGIIGDIIMGSSYKEVKCSPKSN